MGKVGLRRKVKVGVVKETRQQTEDSGVQLGLVWIPLQTLSDERDQVWYEWSQLWVGSYIFQYCRAEKLTISQNAAD